MFSFSKPMMPYQLWISARGRRRCRRCGLAGANETVARCVCRNLERDQKGVGRTATSHFRTALAQCAMSCRHSDQIANVGAHHVPTSVELDKSTRR